MINKLLLFLVFIVVACKTQVEESKADSDILKSMCAPITSDISWYQSDNIAPLFDGMGNLHFPISTKNELVQQYFNQGLTLAYGFNHAEAARSFYYASKLDPDCAMTHWGYAYVLGPNYNAGMEPDHYQRAFEAIQMAQSKAKRRATEKEKELIQALSKRYVISPPEDRVELDLAYADAMRNLFGRYPEDADIGTLFAESLMNLHPWELYDSDGTIKPWTPEILSTLEQVIKQSPNHCGAHHFYIHAVESSGTPQRGLSSAKIFDDGLVPNSGHLVHMPSHIYIRTGDYHLGTVANIQAVSVDSNYVTACHAQGAYPLAYFPHNQHFLSATATLEGNSKWALYSADEVSRNANKQLMSEPEWGTLQHYYTIPYYVYTKFGKWDEILEMENEMPELKYPQAILHYARGMAYLRKDNQSQAEQEWEMLRAFAMDASLTKVTIWDINSVYDLVQIAEKVLHAELLASQKSFIESIDLLKEAVAIEDNLNYNEPPDWFFSVRHHLGAAQLAAGQFQSAIDTYQEDLKRLPKNGWALKGLVIAYDRLGYKENYLSTVSKFEEAWKTADVALSGSIF